MQEFRKEFISVLKDAVIALLILGIILSSLYVYAGRWPPMVVIESPSMSHNEGDPPSSQLGVIDTGDIVAVKTVSRRDDIVTYIEGRASGHSTYGQYGDVIIFRPDGDEDKTPVIHRPVLYLEYNHTSEAFDIPALAELDYGDDWESSEEGSGVYGISGDIIIRNYGHRNVILDIDLDELIEYRHNGYLTMGDNNIRNSLGVYDQGNLRNINEPVKLEWVEGKARGELPWFGSLKLIYMGRTDSVPSNTWRNLVISVIVLISLPVAFEYVLDHYNKDDGDGDDGNEGGIDNDENGKDSGDNKGSGKRESETEPLEVDSNIYY